LDTSTAEWQNFFLAGAGATAALTGLLFVAISINLERILSFPTLPGRAAETLLVLGSALLVSMLALVPGQEPELLGLEVLGLGLVAVLLPLRIQLVARRTDPDLRTHPAWFWSRLGTVALATVPFVVAGVSLLAGAGGGLYWLVPGVGFALVVAVANGWVLLIEILR
jgi:modulator of FtsH protease